MPCIFNAFFISIPSLQQAFDKGLCRKVDKINSDHFEHKITRETKISLKEHKTSAVMNQSALSSEVVFGRAETSSFLSWLISHVTLVT